MKLPLEEIKKIHLQCDSSGRASLSFFYEKGGGDQLLLPDDEVTFSRATPSAEGPALVEDQKHASLKSMADSLRAIQTILERWDAEKKMADEAFINAYQLYKK